MKRIGVILFFILILSACGGEGSDNHSEAADKTLTPVKFALDWMPNTNHTGIYVAKEKGYFEAAGLDVDILLPGEVGSGQLIATEKADLGISYQESLMLARHEGLPLVAVTAIMQHNTAGYASSADKGIETPADLEGKVYGANLSPLSEATLKTLMSESEADVSKIKTNSIGDSDFFVALKRDIDFSLVFQAWTGIEAEIRDIDLNMMYLRDYAEGLDFYTPIIATSESLIASNPELVESFIHAAVQGYQFAIDHPEEAAEILIESEPDLNAELVEKSQAWISPYYQDDADYFGIQEKYRWENVRDFMIEHNLIDENFDVEAAFTNEFLPEK